MEKSYSRKRARPVFSCLRCRDKKLKCDRLTPCENCTKAGCPDECVYNRHPLPSENAPSAKRIHASGDDAEPHASQAGSASHHAGTPGSGGGIGVVEDLQQRVARLEEMLSLSGRAREGSLADDSSPHVSLSARSAMSPSFVGTLVVKGSRSRYHGQNDRATLLNQFFEVKDFVAQCVKDPTVMDLVKEVQFLKQRSQEQMATPAPEPLDCSPALLKLREFLPPKPVCDHLLESYTANYESVFRILHVPSFLRQYNQFWTDPDPSILQTSAFLPQLTALCAVALVMEDHQIKVDDPTSRTYIKSASLDLVSAWLDEISRKQRTEISTIQAELLLLLAKIVRLTPLEQLWNMAGSILRSAMVVGLHMDPLASRSITPFQAEIRRRLWSTIVEIDIQAMIGAGMPYIMPDVDPLPLIPSNLNDSDFDESTMELPPARPLTEMTDSLFQVVLARSLPDRMKIMTLIKSPGAEEDLNKILQAGRKVEEAVERIPAVLKLSQSADYVDSPPGLFNRVLVDLIMRRTLLYLYRPQLLGDYREDSQFLEIQRVCLEYSLVMLSYQDHFDPYVADLDLLSSNSHWEVFKIFCFNDILWAALGVCQYIKASSRFQTSTAGSAASSSSFANPSSSTAALYSKANLTRIVGNTLDAFCRHITDSSAGSASLKDIVFLSIVLQSVRTHQSQERKESLMLEGARRILIECRQHLMQSMSSDSMTYDGTTKSSYVSGEASDFPTASPHVPQNQGVPDMHIQQQTLSHQQYAHHAQQPAQEFFAPLPGLTGESGSNDVFAFGNGAFDIDPSWNTDQFWHHT